MCTGAIPGHQRHGPAGWSSGQPGQAWLSSGTGPGWAWAVPALIATTPATPPHSSAAVDKPTIVRFTNLGLISEPAFMVVPLLPFGP
ncbi:hypothetical protein A5745_04870 [Mycobacterium sp. IS-2888]|nr:hypothetical protein A5745_04870 [Mycobacterium sp. IS-2888]